MDKFIIEFLAAKSQGPLTDPPARGIFSLDLFGICASGFAFFGAPSASTAFSSWTGNSSRRGFFIGNSSWFEQKKYRVEKEGNQEIFLTCSR